MSKGNILYRIRTNLLPLSPAQRRVVIVSGLALGDTVAIGSAYWLAYLTRFIILKYPIPFHPTYYAQLFFLTLPIWLGLFWFYQLYSAKVLFGGLEEYTRMFNAVTIGSALLIFLDFMIRHEDAISRGWLLLFWLFAIILIEIFRFLFRRFIYWIRSRGHFLSSAILVGANPEGRALHENLKNWRHSGLSIIGFVDDELPINEIVQGDLRVLGKIQDLERIVQEHDVLEVIVASGSLQRDQLLDIFRLVSWHPEVALRLSSGVFEIISTGLHIKELASVPLIEVNKTRITGLNAMLKNIMDILIASIALVILCPLFLIISILIRLDSPGPIFYLHRVIGLNGKEFGAIKFRTMVQDSAQILRSDANLTKQFGEIFKLKDDPRITRLGYFLRKISLDELPQLINVLMGQMSIVGPRFISPDEIEKYGEWHMNLLTIKPGMTGLWQVSGRSDISYEERVRLDMYYIRNWTIWLDIYIMLATIPAVLQQRGAY